MSITLLSSCKKDTIDSEEISLESIKKSAEIEVVSDNVSAIIADAYDAEGSLAGRSSDTSARYLPPCMTRTVVVSGLVKTVTLDFGSGCDMPNGNHLSGIITIEYTRNPAANTRSVVYSFTNFYFNNKNIAGGGSIFRELHNSNGNPQTTKNNDITVTWPNGDSAHRVGEKVREWVEGFASGTWGDNVFLITGNWTTEFPNGDVNTGEVSTDLRRELACRFIVSGVIDLTHNGHAGTLDFGDGSCDNEAIFTGPNGVVHIIILD